ncbi:MAG: BlaI/MecI/CopY family transcriptional regulator [Candidatus Gastranaerophilales bacterium]|nr:BlaI/MecI/CopY family transcriptional regulator [Candidatus Gastranaerophilales bacterium]
MMISNHGNLENIVLNAVWDIEENANEPKNTDVSMVQKAININNEQSWAYTTIKTVLDRLVEKNLLRKNKQKRKYLYFSLCSREEMGQKAIKKLALQYFKNDISELLKVVEKVSKEELILV